MPPHIGAVMERSLQDRSWGDALVSLLSRSAVAALGKRQPATDSISSDISDAATAFSSWDNCFQAAFCKYVPFYQIVLLIRGKLTSIDGLLLRCSSLPASLSCLSSGASCDAAAVACLVAAHAAIV